MYKRQDDNCPFDENDDQTDGDADDKGDECDPCPAQANPDSVCTVEATAATIYDVQSGSVSEGSYVRLSGVVVTAIAGSGFHVQDPTFLDSPEYSGIYIYTSSDPGVTRGDVVTVEGQVSEYYDWTQLQDGAVTVTMAADTATCDEEATDPAITPTEVTVEEAASEAFEGVLVTVTDGVVTDSDYDLSLIHI